MEWYKWVILIQSAVMLGVPSWRLLRRVPRAKSWKGVADAFRLSQVRRRFYDDGLNLTGSVEPGFDVTVMAQKGSTNITTQVSLSGESLLWDVGLERAGLLAWKVNDKLSFDDATFSDAFQVGGNAASAHAALNADVRARLMEIDPKISVRLKNGQLSLSTSSYIEGAALTALIEVAVEIATTLNVERESIPSRLAHNARHDPIPAMRRRNLELLLADFRYHPTADAATQSARDDAHPDVRLVAATHVLDIDALATFAADEASRVRRGRALDALALAPAYIREVSETLAAIQPSGDGIVDAPLARALAAHAVPGRQERLLGMLAESDDAGQEAALEALEVVGDLTAVASLLAYSSQPRLSRGQRIAARATITAIQERANVVSGGLAIAEGADASGALSQVHVEVQEAE